MASVIVPTSAASFSTGSVLPSGYPRAQHTPALVVAIAFAPASSNSRALPASHALGRTRSSEELCRSRNCLAKLDINVLFLGGYRAQLRVEWREDKGGLGWFSPGKGRWEPNTGWKPMLH